MIRVMMQFVGPARDLAGTDSAKVQMDDGATVTAFREELASRFPGLRDVLGNMRVAVNMEFAQDEHVLQDGDKAALIPPVCGG